MEIKDIVLVVSDVQIWFLSPYILLYLWGCVCYAVTLVMLMKYLILSYLILSYLILSYLILSYLILSYLILSYLILSYLILSYLNAVSNISTYWYFCVTIRSRASYYAIILLDVGLLHFVQVRLNLHLQDMQDFYLNFENCQILKK